MKSIVLYELADATNRFGIESLSPFCLKVHRALRLSGLQYERKHGDRPAAFAHLNPAAQVPILQLGERVVCDSTRILEAIEEQRPGSFLRIPEALLYEELADTTLNAFLVASRWADERNWPAVRDAYFGEMPAPLRSFVPARLRKGVIDGLRAREVWRLGHDACWARFEEIIDQLDSRAPKHGYWLGDRVSTADLGILAQLRSMQTELTPWQRNVIAKRNTLSTYLGRVDALTTKSGSTVAA
jgi:glutathione S-transferase